MSELLISESVTVLSDRYAGCEQRSHAVPDRFIAEVAKLLHFAPEPEGHVHIPYEREIYRQQIEGI